MLIELSAVIHTRQPKKIILSFGLKIGAPNPKSTSIHNLGKLIENIPQIGDILSTCQLFTKYSAKRNRKFQEANPLGTNDLRRVTIIPCLDSSHFETTSDPVHWTKTNCQQYPEALASSFKLLSEHAGCTNQVSNILDICNRQLSCHEIQVLSKGLNFVPTPKILKEDIETSTHQMCRKIKFQEYFRYKPRFEKLSFTGISSLPVEDDEVYLTTVEFNKNITTEVQNLHVKKEINILSKFEIRL